MSAFLVVKYIDCICDTMSFPYGLDVYSRDTTEASKILIIFDWLNSIAVHTNKNTYHHELNSFQVLLYIADELDEFSRYSHDKTTDGWVNTETKTEINCTSTSLQFTFTFKDTPEEGVLIFFKNKVDKFINRLELSNQSTKKITITCKNTGRFAHVKYYFEKAINYYKKGYVKKSYGKDSYDIFGFLQGDVKL